MLYLNKVIKANPLYITLQLKASPFRAGRRSAILKSTIRSFDFDVVLGMKLPTSSPFNYIEDFFAEVSSPLPLFPLRGLGLMILS
jgi:hypothetical protein